MTALLTDNLPLLAGAPNGIKKLRELILELAVRGKLVPQDPNDEPASELLKRIAEEKARLVAEGKIKKQKPLAEIGEEEKPFDLPTNWEWVRIAAVGHDWGQKTPDKSFTYIDVGAVDNAAGRISTPQVLMAEGAPSRARKVVQPGTVIYSTIRPYLLNVAVIDEAYEQEPIASTAFAIIHPYLEMPARYFLWYLRSPVFVRYVESVQMGIAYPAINDGQFFSGLIPLPPLAEQHRIVAKVDELMTLCDRLEAQQDDAESAHAQLVQALLGSLTQAADAEAFAASWQRLAEHFHTLFTTESSIDALKQTLLQLAVMGKLVPQDPNDEPASELLRRIADESTRLVAGGTVKKGNVKAGSVAQGVDGIELPVKWTWTTFDDLINPKYPVAYGVLVPGPDVADGVPFVRIADLDLVAPPPKPEKSISPDIDRQFERTRLRGGEILMGVVGSIGKLGIAPDNWAGANIARAICRLVPSEHVSKDYIIWLLQSDLMRTQFLGDTRTLAQPTLNVGLIRNASTPLPPLAEQHRIVAKVDQLMALCDQLKTRLTQARQLNEQLATALVEQAVA
ncbi:restriction endonuclease subunit S [Stutzerimonas frequens]|uniref:restriction endonuclease subunit S n=1 Tax=Stutzerimonas frequens TaxID=2968969 RepID=UPI000D7DAE24|nr:restriction endonuclease subunit S [Stutzerimonas frequens]AWT09053.1 restriction endonuclease subunit S [Stutzerimonas frequens]